MRLKLPMRGLFLRTPFLRSFLSRRLAAWLLASGVLLLSILKPIALSAGPVPGLSLIWPIPSGFTSKPGQSYGQFNDGSPNRHHAGLDIPAPLDTNVVAAGSGTVRVVRLTDNGNKTHCLGNVVIINYGVAATLYAYLKTILVSSGQFVNQGITIGTVGNTVGDLQSGAPCPAVGPHLHFELKNQAVLAVSNDHGPPNAWGYTPEIGVAGQPIPSHHPDSYGFHDPIHNIESISNIPPTTVMVTPIGASGNGLSMRIGPSTTYRDIGLRLQQANQEFRAGRQSVASANCSSGWYQIQHMSGQYFADASSGGSVRQVWVCRGNGSETWLSGQPDTNISLAFPLAGLNPYTAPISSVVDHSSIPGGRFYSGSGDNAVVGYTGELGRDRCGPSRPCGFLNPSNNDFVVNGNYVGASADGVSRRKVLNYEGHPGYDYSCTAGEPVLAGASGTLIVPTSDPINGSPTTFNTFKIVHVGGWETWYLHTRNNLPSGTVINSGQTVAQCWNTGPPGTPVHLHFEVRRNGKIVDPYGWEWNTADPISMNSQALVQLDPLWGIAQPKVNSVSLTPISGGFTATITGQNFASGAVVTLWDRYSQFFVQAINPTTPPTPTQIVANLLISPRRPEDFVLKVRNPAGPRSKGVALSVSTTSSFVPLALIGQPAPGGGTFNSFASFYAMNNRGDVMFNAVVDTSGAGTFKFSGGQFSRATVPGIGTAGAVRINNGGDEALSHSQAIYFLKSGSSIPIKIAEQGQPSPVGGTFDELGGPLAISDNGEVTFSSRIIDPVTKTSTCCYLFMYSNVNGSTIKVFGSGDPTPLGGTFASGPQGANQITSDGDVVFIAGVNGGSSSIGIFRFSRTLGLSKVVAAGDPVPTPLGGTLGTRITMSFRSVSGRRVVFQAIIAGGTARQAIFAKDDVTLPAMRIIAYQGQPTGTEVGGTFDSLDHEPFSPVGDTPHIRADGGVLFIAFYSHVGGLPTGRGIFLWTGKEFKKVVVNGDRLPSGQTLNGVSSYIMNDIGQVAYFVASIN